MSVDTDILDYLSLHIRRSL